MDFFEHQDVARRKTSLLVIYFALAVVLIILAVYFIFWLIFAAGAAEPDSAQPLWNADLFFWVAGITVLIVAVGTLTKTAALSSGGEAVARMLGARPIDIDTSDLNERQLLNVVEEIAIASGTPIPRLFLIDDNSINAFAAGYSTQDAIIGVTRGCMELLSRDELQGVIAHEFSHILNGDMRLNIKLMGTLHGILVLGIIGYWIFRMALHSSPSRSSNRRKQGNPLPFILLGLSVMAIGYIGVFFGKLIKSAVSRQREFLADASSVQFTRNPDGIAGALKKIGATSSRLASPNAEQASHLFFANGLSKSFLGLMATHPPLAERIKRIDPSFDGDFSSSLQRAAARSAATAASMTSSFAGATGSDKAELKPEAIIESVGKPSPENLAYVSGLLSAVPESVRSATRDSVGAQAVLYGLLLDRSHSSFENQVRHLKANSEPAVFAKTMSLVDQVERLPAELRLPSADMTLPALRHLAADQLEALSQNLVYLASADSEISLFEYALLRMSTRRISSITGKAKPRVRYHELGPLLPAASAVLSALAYFGATDEAEASVAFKRAMSKMGEPSSLILSVDDSGLSDVDKALDKFAEASALIKKLLLSAAIECIISDGTATVEETEMLRAIADSLDCPVPPIPVMSAA